MCVGTLEAQHAPPRTPVAGCCPVPTPVHPLPPDRPGTVFAFRSARDLFFHFLMGLFPGNGGGTYAPNPRPLTPLYAPPHPKENESS